MGLRIQNNIAAMNAHRQLSIADAGLSKSLERLSSGYRINGAKDDAAGLSISQGFRADIASYKVASRNVTEGNALLQVAEGAMDQIGNMLTRLKELATQAASANAATNIGKINSEGNQLLLEIDRIANSTTYAGTKLIDGTFGVSVVATTTTSTFNSTSGLAGVSGLQSGQTYNIAVVTSGAGEHDITVSATLASGQRYSETVYDIAAVTGTTSTIDVKFATLGLTLTLNSTATSTLGDGKAIVARTATASDFQIGAKNSGDDRIGITLTSLTAASLNTGLVADKLDTATEAQAFLTTVDSAISALNTKRGDIGAAQNRLGYASANLASTIENITAADSVIRDVDMAAEMTSFTKNQILLQASTAMLAQANMAPQNILSLFGG
ncbi:MAG: flagellin [Proteobacteria bacterium]|nr:flagellin [Pseudomonadota bacterium]